MSMNDHIQEILGKRIVGVVAKKWDRLPRNMVILVFDDGTSYELYGEGIHFAKGLDRGGMAEARGYLPGMTIAQDWELGPVDGKSRR